MITISSELEKEYIEIAKQLKCSVESLINGALEKELRIKKNLIERRNRSLDKWLNSIDSNGTTVLYPSSCNYNRNFQQIEFDNIILCSNELSGGSSKIGKVLSLEFDNNEVLGALRRRNIKLNAIVIICDGCVEGGNYECCADMPFIKKLIPLMSEDFNFYSDHGKFHEENYMSNNNFSIESIEIPNFVNIFRQYSKGKIRLIHGWKIKKLDQNSIDIKAKIVSFANIEICEYSEDICNANIFIGDLFVQNISKIDFENGFPVYGKFEAIENYLKGLFLLKSITSMKQKKITDFENENFYEFMLNEANDKKIEIVTYISYLADDNKNIYEYLKNWEGEYPKKINLFSIKHNGF